MTVIVGVQHDKGAVIGSDSFLGNQHFYRKVSTPKTIRNGPFVIGTAGSVRWAQIMEHHFKAPTHHPDMSDEAYMSGPFIDALRMAAKKGGALFSAHGFDQADAAALTAYRGILYAFYSDFQIAPVIDSHAVGAGAIIATGSLDSTKGQDPVKRVQIALEVTADNSPWVCAPFHILEQKRP